MLEAEALQSKGMILLPTTPPAPVHVIVDHIPTTPGLSPWASTLLSAGIGALFGIVSGTLMEFLKPLLTRFLLMRKMKPQLIAELYQNMNDVRAVVRARGTDQTDERMVADAEYLMSRVDHSRFSHYLEKEPLAVYDFDEEKRLQHFYETFKTVIPDFVSMRREGNISAALISETINDALNYGAAFLVSHNLAVEQ